MFTRNLHIPRQEVIPNNGLAPDDDTTYRNNPKSQTITSCEHDVALGATKPNPIFAGDTINVYIEDPCDGKPPGKQSSGPTTTTPA